ncbi:DUF6271 family protein [Streptomyces sp. NPDC057694]|uniref:DUF6271 family protein n=1 Tax=Streptomyces sp. NPDC057694 TaxID=3346216 RepID=UPI003683FEAF
MRRICLTLPTDRPCTPAIAGIAREAAYGARTFGVEVHILVLDSAPAAARAEHRTAIDHLTPAPGVVVHHLDEQAQRVLLRDLAATAAPADTARLLELLLPAGVSYGACTDRAFLIAETLGCASVHRRDSDSSYQEHDGESVFPIHQELAFLDTVASDAGSRVSVRRLRPGAQDRRVALVGGSFIGEMSVDLDGIRQRDPAAYERILTLTVPDDYPALWRATLAADSFRGGGTTPFTEDRTTLTSVPPTRVDMCNIALSRAVYATVPLPPARDTVGSDYFLLHAVHAATLPGVLHNRHIVNHHTPDRRTDAAFLAYQVRLAKYFLAVPRLHEVHTALATAGPDLLDEHGRIRTAAVADPVRLSAADPRPRDARRLDTLDAVLRGLGGRWTQAADLLAARRDHLLAEAASDMADFAFLLDAWPALIRAARAREAVGAR